MRSYRFIVPILAAVIVIQAVAIAMIYLQPTKNERQVEYSPTDRQTRLATYKQFNQPISNDTDFHLQRGLNGSWLMIVRSTLDAPVGISEAQIAVAPEYPSENLSIPTIIIQERSDGLLRVEYFAQNWPNTYGLVLYNSTNPGWSDNENVTIRFVRFGAASQVNPELAPRPNGNLTIVIGQRTVLSDFPIAWANLSTIYLYGYPGSSFRAGLVSISFYELIPKK